MRTNQQRILETNRRVLQRMQSNCDEYKITVDVIIAAKTCVNTLGMTINCIHSLRQSEDNIIFNVVLIESGEFLGDMGQDTTIMYSKVPFVYNEAMNIGISSTRNDWVVLANNDLIFKKNWMTEIINAHNLRKDIESFSPWNDMWDWHKRCYGDVYPNIIDGYRIGMELAGWCIIARRDVFSRFKLSERVQFWYSDNVYADDLMKHGIKHALVTGSKVDHIVSQTHVVSLEESQSSRRQYLTSET